MLKPVFGFLLSLFGGQVFHIGRQAPDEVHAHVLYVVLNVAVGGGVIKMLGGGNLGGDLAGHIDAVGLHQLDELMQLTGGDESVYRIGKQQHIGL